MAVVAGLAACTLPGDPPPAVIGAKVPGEAEGACMAAVKETTGAAGSFAVIGSDVSEAGTTVMIQVPGATAPWSCRASIDGRVEDVMFTGSEGWA